MEIQELIIKSYGKFSNHQMTFRPGINIIYGGNETGKTTIHSFIRAMLFGLNRGRGRAAKMDEYQLRQPWDAPGAFLGSMRFTEDGEVYRIDRCFDRSAKPLELVCESKELVSAHPQEDLDALLGGISENAFVNSVFIGQAQCETDEALSGELRRYMINSENSMDSEIDVTGALQELRKRKKKLEQQQKKEEAALEEKIAGNQEKADQVRQELELLRQEAAHAGNTQGQSQGMRNEEYAEENSAPRWMHTLLCVLLLAAGVLTLAGIFLTQVWALRVFLGVFTALFWGMALGVHFLFQPSENTPREEAADETSGMHTDLAELMRRIQDRETEYGKLQDELEILYQRHAQAGSTRNDPSVQEPGFSSSKNSGIERIPESTDTEIAALMMAIDRICDISDRIYRENGGRLNARASEILEEITGGRYSRIVIDDTAEVRIHTPSRVLGLNQVSGGTMQQIYFALRMAAGELLGEGVTLPVILDETFAMYDDRRLEATLSWLKKSGRQVILFTCQNREREILKRIS